MHEHNVNKGIALTAISTIFAAMISLFSKLGNEYTSVPLTLFFRFAMPLLFVFPGAFKLKAHLFEWPTLKYFLLRSFLIFMTQICFIFYLSYGSLLDAVLLMSTGPLFMPLLARIFMKKELKRKTIFCLLIGFVGVACILRPTNGLIDWHALIGLCSGLFLASTQIALHKVTRLATVMQQLFLIFLFSAMMAGCFMLFFSSTYDLIRQITDTTVLFIFIGFAISSVFNQVLRSLAYRYVHNPATVAPFMYFSLVFAMILQWLVFNQLPNFMSIIGAALVVLAGLFMRPWKRKPQIGI